ncbi:MAG: rhomboid family intramembrane serine protease [Methanobacteriota archaeon]|nr:MAG: rhomboid family intramembrane serine protease [Euryarchaeota archaeon]
MEPVSIAALGVVGLATVYAFVRKALLSLVYGVTILLVFALQVISAPGPVELVSKAPVTMELGLRVASPTTWSWLTFEFVHGSQTHVVLNLLGLILISPTFEERIGSARWALLFFVGGAFGALVFVLVHLGQPILLVGASAGIFAVFGAYGRLYPRDRVSLFLPLPGLRPLPVIQVVVLFLALEAVLGVLLPGGIAWEGHAGALVFGFAAAPAIMRLPLPGRRSPRLRSLAGWKDLATTFELVRILEEAERADLAETREAWVEKFVAAARCPQCGGPLRLRFGRLTSKCGWRRSA